jgi:hypothetical protein
MTAPPVAADLAIDQPCGLQPIEELHDAGNGDPDGLRQSFDGDPWGES